MFIFIGFGKFRGLIFLAGFLFFFLFGGLGGFLKKIIFIDYSFKV